MEWLFRYRSLVPDERKAWVYSCRSSDLVDPRPLQIVTPWAFQYKLIGGFGYTLTQQECTMTFGIDGDVTLFSTGVGRDYMVTLRLRCTILRNINV